MKLFLIQDRIGKLHLVDFTTSTGSKFTVCNQTYQKRQIVNFFAIDAAINDVCRTCHDTFEKMYQHYLESNPRSFKNQQYNKMLSKLDSVLSGTDIQSTYWFVEQRISNKIGRYRNLLNRNKNKAHKKLKLVKYRGK